MSSQKPRSQFDDPKFKDKVVKVLPTVLVLLRIINTLNPYNELGRFGVKGVDILPLLLVLWMIISTTLLFVLLRSISGIMS